LYKKVSTENNSQRPWLCEGWVFCVPVARLAVAFKIIDTAKLQKIIRITIVEWLLLQPNFRKAECCVHVLPLSLCW
jgi:hypothetical protein